MKKDSNIISVSAFARKIGVSHTYVQKAIAAGKITAVTPDKKIIVDSATQQASDWNMIKIEQPKTKADVMDKIYIYRNTFEGYLSLYLSHEKNIETLLSLIDNPVAFQQKLNDYIFEGLTLSDSDLEDSDENE